MKSKYFPHALIILVGTILVVTSYLMVPSFVSAQTTLVVCGTGGDIGVAQNSATGCQACHLFQLIDRLIKFLIYIGVSIASLLFAYAGFLYVTAGGGHSVDEAKGIFKDVLIGLVIALCGYLVVDTILRSVASGSFAGPSWQTIQCANRDIQQIAGGGIGFTQLADLSGLVNTSSAPPPVTSADFGDVTKYRCDGSNASNCVPVNSTGIQNCDSKCSGSGCAIDPGFASSLSAVGGNWCASSIGIESGHSNACHTQYGNCIDATCGRGTSCSADQAKALQDSFRVQNLWPVYELPSGTSQATLSQYKAAGVCAYIEPASTGGHFSVYVSKPSGAGQFSAAGNCFQ